MLTLDEYKNYLLGFYRYPYDSIPSKRKEREFHLQRQYSDEQLEKIINDSYSFAKDVLETDTIKNDYCSFELDEDNSFGINLFLCGGAYSDYIYIDNDNRTISNHILESIFGNTLIIEVKCDEIERECEEDVLSFDYHYSIYMQGFPDNLNEIKDNLFGKGKVLSK